MNHTPALIVWNLLMVSLSQK